eukprot:1156432-Pelagomonas_calceolata.AAC.1
MTLSTDFEGLALELLAHKAVVKVLLGAPVELRTHCCNAILLRVAQLYQIRIKINKKEKKRKVYAGQRPRALREGPLPGKLEASQEISNLQETAFSLGLQKLLRLEFERARALCAATLLHAPSHLFGNAAKHSVRASVACLAASTEWDKGYWANTAIQTLLLLATRKQNTRLDEFCSKGKSVASTDLALQRHDQALSSLKLAEREASACPEGGMSGYKGGVVSSARVAALCYLMKLRAYLELRNWDESKKQILNLIHCMDFQCMHLQVAYAEAMTVAQAHQAGAAKCAVLCLQLLKGYSGCSTGPSAQQELCNGQAHAASPVCPGRLCLHMLAALALLRPTSDSASKRKLWVEQLVEELRWAASVLKEGGMACFTQGDSEEVSEHEAC